MDENVIAKAKALSQELANDPVIKEYLRLKKEIENNEEIKSLNENIMLLKRQKASLEEIKAAEMEYNNHPLMANYLELQKEAFSILKEIRDIIG